MEDDIIREQSLRKSDLLFGVALVFISVCMFINSVELFFNPFGRPFSEIQPQEIKSAISNWHQSPALFPGIIALIVFFLGIVLINFALVKGAKIDFLHWNKIKNFMGGREVHVFVIIIGLLLCYAFALLPICRRLLDFFPRFQGFPFMIATFLYLFVTMIVFNKKSKTTVMTSAIVSAFAASAIAYGFGMLALIPLP